MSSACVCGVSLGKILRPASLLSCFAYDTRVRRTEQQERDPLSSGLSLWTCKGPEPGGSSSAAPGLLLWR